VSGEAASRLFAWALRWLLLAALWLALADSRALTELVAAGVFATLGAAFAGLIVRPGQPRTLRGLVRLARVRPLLLLRPLWRLPADAWLLTRALAERLLRGKTVAGSFRSARHAPPVEARTAAGRAVAEIWGSLMPNRYVVGIDDEEQVILVHELIRSDEPLDPLAR
jgi:hypothetical protein